MAKTAKFSDRLAQRLSIHRTATLQIEVARHPQVAPLSVHVGRSSMLRHALMPRSIRSTSSIAASAEENSATSSPDFEGFVASAPYTTQCDSRSMFPWRNAFFGRSVV